MDYIKKRKDRRHQTLSNETKSKDRRNIDKSSRNPTDPTPFSLEIFYPTLVIITVSIKVYDLIKKFQLNIGLYF